MSLRRKADSGSDELPSLQTHPNDPFELVSAPGEDPVYRRREDLPKDL